MPDRQGLGLIGWTFGAVTAAVIAISGVVVTASVMHGVTGSSAVTLSAAAR